MEFSYYISSKIVSHMYSYTIMVGNIRVHSFPSFHSYHAAVEDGKCPKHLFAPNHNLLGMGDFLEPFPAEVAGTFFTVHKMRTCPFRDPEKKALKSASRLLQKSKKSRDGPGLKRQAIKAGVWIDFQIHCSISLTLFLTSSILDSHLSNRSAAWLIHPLLFLTWWYVS